LAIPLEAQGCVLAVKLSESWSNQASRMTTHQHRKGEKQWTQCGDGQKGHHPSLTSFFIKLRTAGQFCQILPEIIKYI